MSLECSSIPKPDTSNVCNNLNDTHIPEHTCINFSQIPLGIILEDEFCKTLGNPGEWGQGGFSNFLCGINPCDSPQELEGCCVQPEFPFVCCSTIVGLKALCKRIGFTGNPVNCCFNNYDNESQNSNCFSDTSQKATCDPAYRSIIGEGCRDQLLNYCSGNLPGDNPNSTEWISRWVDSSGKPIENGCYKALQWNLYGSDPPPVLHSETCREKPLIPLNSSGFTWSQELMNVVFAKYTTNGYRIGSLPGSPTYNSFQEFLYTICCDYPGLCQNGLNNVCSDISMNRLSLNPEASAWCGCHLPLIEYSDYANRFNIPPECSPICNRAGVLPIAKGDAEPIECTQTICLIDDITINVVNSQIGGDIDITQICGNCSPEAPCSCFINNDSISINNSFISGNVSIQQSCGSFQCTQNNPGIPGPNLIEINCNDQPSYNKYKEEAQKQKEEIIRNKNVWILAIILIFVLILFLVIAFFNISF